MTKSQYKVFNKLQKKQVNKEDVAVVETSESSCTIWVAFPGLYLTYDPVGKLIATETLAERIRAGKPVSTYILEGEMGG